MIAPTTRSMVKPAVLAVSCCLLCSCASTPGGYYSTYVLGSSPEVSKREAEARLPQQMVDPAKVPGFLDRPPQFKRFVAPEMPARAIDNGIVGEVVVQITVGESGQVIHVAVVQSPDKILSDAVVSAASSWLFVPETSGGKPTEFMVQQSYEFRLP